MRIAFQYGSEAHGTKAVHHYYNKFISIFLYRKLTKIIERHFQEEHEQEQISKDYYTCSDILFLS